MKKILGLILVLAVLSCGKETTRPQAQQPQLAANDTPEHAALRFLQTYERKMPTEYALMFTGDFTYEFSNSTDPDLVNKYSTGWFKTDEDTSGQHLFLGFTPQDQPPSPAASSVNIDFKTTVPVDDNAVGVDPVTHKLLATRVDGQIVIPPTPPATDPTNYLIENNYNAFYLVRGDEAIGLSVSQPADTTHWYIYRWVDLTVALSSLKSPHAAGPATWGKVKGLYR